MTKYKLNKGELQEHWNDQIRFIQKSIIEFDAGDEKEAKRIATNLRILFHNTRNSKSIFKQLNLQMTFYSCADLYTPSNLLTSWTLLNIIFISNEIQYQAKLSNSSRCFFLRFDDWWNEIIFDDHYNRFTRRDIVLYIADQDGGAHVDPAINELFAKLSKMNSLGWSDRNGNIPTNNPAYHAIRAIANELLISICFSQIGLKKRIKQKNKEFEMRIVDDEGRRYKWSKTEIIFSPETMKIVEQDRMEKRTLYIDEYKDGKKIEYVG